MLRGGLAPRLFPPEFLVPKGGYAVSTQDGGIGICGLSAARLHTAPGSKMASVNWVEGPMPDAVIWGCEQHSSVIPRRTPPLLLWPLKQPLPQPAWGKACALAREFAPVHPLVKEQSLPLLLNPGLVSYFCQQTPSRRTLLGPEWKRAGHTVFLLEPVSRWVMGGLQMKR